MAKFDTDAYFIGIADCCTKVKALFPKLDMAWLDDDAPVAKAPKEAEVLPTNDLTTEGGKAPLL